MAHDGQDLQDIVVDSGDASSGVNNAAESPAAAAGNGNQPTTTASISLMQRNLRYSISYIFGIILIA
jgi:hypothetical protein